MEQENKLLKEREKERTELMNLDLNDNDHMIQHLDNMKDKYIKMKNNNEDQLKNLNLNVIELIKDKNSKSNQMEKAKVKESELSENANHLAKELERRKEENRREIELLRKDLDNQQRKAKQATIEYTEARNELLELTQSLNKSLKDQEELKNEKEDRTNNRNVLKDKLTNTLNALKRDIAVLEDDIFNSDDYKIKKLSCETYIKDQEKLIKEEKFNQTKAKQLDERKDKLTTVNGELIEEQSRLKLDIEDKNLNLIAKLEAEKKDFDKKVKSLSTRELNEAKERKSIRTTKNNELEEQFNIRKIEMRKQRDKLINEVDEKRELQNQYNKLDDAYKDQAQEISNYKHRISELSMGIEEKQENISKLEESLTHLKRKEVLSDDLMSKITVELNELRSTDQLDLEIEKFPIEKLKNFQKD